MSSVSLLNFQTPPLEIARSTFDILTFVVPPSLPACMTIASYLAQRRLKRRGIYCLSSKYINLAGNINVVAFDKVKPFQEGKKLQLFMFSTAGIHYTTEMKKVFFFGILSFGAILFHCHRHSKYYFI